MGAGQSSAVLMSAMREYRTTAGLSELILLDMEWNQDARPPRRGTRAQQWGWNRPGRLLTWGICGIRALASRLVRGYSAVPVRRVDFRNRITVDDSQANRLIRVFATSAART